MVEGFLVTSNVLNSIKSWLNLATISIDLSACGYENKGNICNQELIYFSKIKSFQLTHSL